MSPLTTQQVFFLVLAIIVIATGLATIIAVVRMMWADHKQDQMIKSTRRPHIDERDQDD